MNEATPSIDSFDSLDPAVLQCPYPFYQAMQRDAPVYQARPGFFMVARYADLQEALRKPEIFSNAIRPLMQIPSELDNVLMPAPALILADLPLHRHSRALVAKAFTATRVNAMEHYIQRIVDELIDGFTEQRRVELCEQFSVPVPMTVIADQLGAPRSERAQFKQWSNAILLAFSLTAPREQRLAAGRQVAEFNAYFLEILRRKRIQPSEDIISVLATATLDSSELTGEGARPLTDDEFLTIVQLLLVGGNETTTSTINSCMLLLLRNPEVLERLRQEPRNIRLAIEETLRMESPSRGNMRVTTQDTTLGGVHIPAGSLVNLTWAAGNRDARRFECPERFDIGRPQLASHLAFGGGIHHCVGSLLAKKESEIAIRTLLSRLRNIRLAADRPPPEYAPLDSVRYMTALHLEFDSA